MKTIHESGKRKTAVARVTLKAGSGRTTINNLSLDQYEPKMARMKIQEPLLLAGDISNKIDVEVNVFGGGVASQSEAIRLAIGRALAKYNAKYKDILLNYDRQLLVADVRRKECSKPNSRGRARAKRQKSYR